MPTLHSLIASLRCHQQPLSSQHRLWKFYSGPQDAAKVVRERAAGAADRAFLEEAQKEGHTTEALAAVPDEDADAAAAEAQYHAELRAELQVRRKGYGYCQAEASFFTSFR